MTKLTDKVKQISTSHQEDSKCNNSNMLQAEKIYKHALTTGIIKKSQFDIPNTLEMEKIFAHIHSNTHGRQS